MGISRLSAKQPWTATWVPGTNLVYFFNLYNFLGDATISTATSVQTTLDGPIQVARYGALTVNVALTASQRCRGLILLADNQFMAAAGRIGMDARGAAGAKNWAVDKDIFVPQSITFTGKNTSYADFLKWIRQTGYCIFDPSMYACPPPGMGDVQCDWATWTPFGSTIISAAGCGARKACSTDAGQVGNAGVSAPGGGGTAGYGSAWSAPGRTWGGGPGGGCILPTQSDFALIADQYGGQGGTGYITGTNACGAGGAGNPGGPGNTQGAYIGQRGEDGTGGILIAICRGGLTLTAGHSFTANGSKGGSATSYNNNGGGGGSGGGFVGVFYGSKNATAVSMAANGGDGGNGDRAGGAGGAGSTRYGAISGMGWI